MRKCPYRLQSAAVLAFAMASTWLVSAHSWQGLRVVSCGVQATLPFGKPNTTVDEPIQLQNGKALYGRHCAQCHGEQGNGAGIAAGFLYPKPRNFQEGKFKLVSTVNRIPTDDDLMQAITRGMPGSSMLAFGHLPEIERSALVSYVRSLTRSGIEARLKKAYEDSGDDLDPKQLAREVLRQTTPGELLSWPAGMPAEEDTSIGRGRKLYLANCANCHGESGRGEGGKDQRDDDGTPTQPRDFTQGIFKGGRDAPSLLRRIQIGMPGTPMPATSHLKPTELADMVHFVRSLAPIEAQTKVEHKRQTLAARRVNAIDDEAWRKAASVNIVTAPLWWRNWTSPELKAQALHDGKQLTVKLSWKDPTRNDLLLRPEDFEDQASIQLFDGPQEPFIGMGAHGFGVVDIWLWKASQSVDQTARQHLLDEYPYDTPFYAGLFGRTPHASRPLPSLYPGRATGNQNSASVEGRSASSLMAAGPGSTTFRPKGSQLVTAQAKHVAGVWNVVFSRPLAVPVTGGANLAGGKKVFIAFSLWDGGSNDRNGQKQISMWHELTVE